MRSLLCRAKDQRHRDTFVPEILVNLRRRLNASTAATSSHLLLGHSIKRSGEHEVQYSLDAQARIDAARQHQAEYAPRPGREEAGMIKVNDMVYIKSHGL